MAAKGYCTADEVAEFLGRTFTAAQETYCDKVIERVEIFVDEETNRGWLMGAQTDERHDLKNTHLVYLRYAPVTSVTTITGRTVLGGTETTLVANEDYEVLSLENGEIRIVTCGWERLLVDYTPVATVPADLKDAVIEIVAARMQPHLNPGSFGLDSYSLPDLTVRYARSHVQEIAPPMAMRVLDHYHYPVHA